MAAATVAALAVPAGAAAPPGRGGVSVLVNAAATSLRPINGDLVGVDGPGPTASYARMRAIGVHFVRTDVGFEGTVGSKPVYDCTTGTWDPAALDHRVAGIRAEGGTPLEIVDYSPACLSADPTSENPSYAPPDTGSDSARWDALVTEMALHEITKEGVRWFEVWNEPDWTFFTGGLDGYLHLYADTARALERAAAQAHVHIEVGGPALADVFDKQDTSWLGPFLAYVSQHHLPLGFVSWHSYANDPYGGPSKPGAAPICLGRPTGPGPNPCYYNPGLTETTIASEVTETRQALAKYPGLHPRLIVDEWNVDGLGDPRMDGPYDAAYAAAVLESAQDDRLSSMSWFDVADSPTNPDDDWGLLTARFGPKPVYETFSYWHHMEPEQVPALVTTSAGSPPDTEADGLVGAVASKSRGGVVTVLLYDFKPYAATGDYGTTDPTTYAHQVDLTVTGLPDTGHRYVEQRVASPSWSGTVSHTTPGPSTVLRVRLSPLAGDEVALVTITPR